MSTKNNIFRALVIILNSYLLAVAASGNSTFLAPEDIRIKNYNGFLNVKNPNGGYVIDNISGSAELKATGSIVIGKIDGDLMASTPIGDIEIGEAMGNVRINSQAGNVSINKAQKHVFVEAGLGEVVIQSAKSVQVNNILGGDVKLLDILGYSNVSTNGNILLIVNDQFNGLNLCDLSTTEGDITIYIPRGLGVNIEIKTPFSPNTEKETRIKSDFAFDTLNQKYEKGYYFVITTKINNGGSKMNLQVNKGDIYLKNKK